MKSLIIAARLLSSVFRPAYIPLVGFIILFTITYLNIFSWQYKLWVICATFVFTIALPWIGIRLYKRFAGLSVYELRHRKHRLWPYCINLLCYISFLKVMKAIHLPHFVCGIIFGALLIQGVCLLLNMRWKVSMHSAGAGGIIGALVAYAYVFSFNPVWWLCGAILLDGVVMSSRMILRQHSLWQVLAGSAVGIVCGYLGIALA